MLPLIEPWEYVGDGSTIRGVLDNKTISLASCVGGDASLSRGCFEDSEGTVFEVGAPSENQLATWSRRVKTADDDAPTRPKATLVAAAPSVAGKRLLL